MGRVPPLKWTTEKKGTLTLSSLEDLVLVANGSWKWNRQLDLESRVPFAGWALRLAGGHLLPGLFGPTADLPGGLLQRPLCQRLCWFRMSSVAQWCLLILFGGKGSLFSSTKK